MGLSNRETAHRWAAGKHEHGRSSNRNVFFEGDALYSYGRHYMTAFAVRNPKPEMASNGLLVLLNSDGYSVTTAHHRSDAVGAAFAEGARIVDAPDLTKLAEALRWRDSNGTTASWEKPVVREWAQRNYGDNPGACDLVLDLFNMGRSKNAIRKKAEQRIRRDEQEAERAKREACKRELTRFYETSDADRAEWLARCEHPDALRKLSARLLKLMQFAMDRGYAASTIASLRAYRRDVRAKLTETKWYAAA